MVFSRPYVSYAAKKNSNFSFKPSPSCMYRMPYNPSEQGQMSGRVMKKIPDMPKKMNDGIPSRQRLENYYRNGSVATSYEDGYASAMEPMDNDEWGEDGYWMTDSAYDQISSMPAKRQSPYVNAPRENPPAKNMKCPALPYAKQMPDRGPSSKAKPLRQSLLNIDSSKGLTVKLEPKPQKISPIRSFESGRALFPKWGSSSPISSPKIDFDERQEIFPKVFTVTIEKLLQWPKVLTGSRAIFELYGILDGVSGGKFPRSKRITLRSEKLRDRITCTFFEVDRPLPVLEKNKWQRCILLVRCNEEYQCLKIRSATSNELKHLDQMVTKSSKSKALLLKSIHA